MFEDEGKFKPGLELLIGGLLLIELLEFLQELKEEFAAVAVVPVPVPAVVVPGADEDDIVVVEVWG